MTFGQYHQPTPHNASRMRAPTIVSTRNPQLSHALTTGASRHTLGEFSECPAISTAVILGFSRLAKAQASQRYMAPREMHVLPEINLCLIHIQHSRR